MTTLRSTTLQPRRRPAIVRCGRVKEAQDMMRSLCMLAVATLVMVSVASAANERKREVSKTMINIA